MPLVDFETDRVVVANTLAESVDRNVLHFYASPYSAHRASAIFRLVVLLILFGLLHLDQLGTLDSISLHLPASGTATGTVLRAA
jgi:hypothetical protein